MEFRRVLFRSHPNSPLGPGGEPPQGLAASWGAKAQQVLKKFVRLASAFPSPPTRSLSNRKGRGRRSGGREREPRRAGEGRCLESKLLRPDRLSVITKMFSWSVGSKDEGAAPEIDSQIDPDITPDITPTHDP